MDKEWEECNATVALCLGKFKGGMECYRQRDRKSCKFSPHSTKLVDRLVYTQQWKSCLRLFRRPPTFA